MTPEIHVELKPAGLVLAGRSTEAPAPGEVKVAPPPWRTSGVDVELTADGGGDKGAFSMLARLADKVGPLFVLAAASHAVPYRELVETSDHALERLSTVPFT